MQHNIIINIIINSSFSYQKKLFLFHLESERNISFFVPIFRNIFFLIVTVIITERFNIHFSRIRWLVVTWSFLLCCAPNCINTPLLYCWNWSKVSQLLPSSIILKIFYKSLTQRGQRKLVLTCLNEFRKHSFQFSVRNWNCKW